jgi:hypothetical protein
MAAVRHVRVRMRDPMRGDGQRVPPGSLRQHELLAGVKGETELRRGLDADPRVLVHARRLAPDDDGHVLGDEPLVPVQLQGPVQSQEHGDDHLGQPEHQLDRAGRGGRTVLEDFGDVQMGGLGLAWPGREP